MSRRRLNVAAPELLSAAKYAVRELSSGSDLSANRRDSILKVLQGAIDKAEDSAWRIRFTITPRTWDEIQVMTRKYDDGSAEAAALKSWLAEGYRKTARRVYIENDVDVTALSSFRRLLADHHPPGATSRAFDRLISQIDEEVLNRPPLEALARMGF